MLTKAILVTNDLFRDHIVAWAPPEASADESEALKRPDSLIHPWAESRHMRYTISRDFRDGWHVNLKRPSPIAKRIHPLVPLLKPPSSAGSPPVHYFAALVEGEDTIGVL